MDREVWAYDQNCRIHMYSPHLSEADDDCKAHIVVLAIIICDP